MDGVGGGRRRALTPEWVLLWLECLAQARSAAGTGALAYSGRVGEIPLEEVPREVTDAAHDAARGQVVYLTERGERLAAIVPAELAAELENLTPQQFRELLEDFADAQAAREALAEVDAGAKPVPAEQVWAELGLGT
jgi:antitoxin Phd